VLASPPRDANTNATDVYFPPLLSYETEDILGRIVNDSSYTTGYFRAGGDLRQTAAVAPLLLGGV
jgi:hypothetical protein